MHIRASAIPLSRHSGESVERAPFSTNADFRNHANLGEIDYEDMHLGHMAERLRRGFYGDIDWAVIEVSAIEEYAESAACISPRQTA